MDPASALPVCWDWEDDGIFDTEWSTTERATHSYGALGQKAIRLQVQDTHGSTDSVSHQVTIVEKPASHRVFLPAILRQPAGPIFRWIKGPVPQ